MALGAARDRGVRVARRNGGRVLRSWFVVTVAGVALALVTGWLPADRFITFGFAIPILAALGVVRVWRWLQRRRALAVAVTIAMVVAMLAGSWIAWSRQEPFVSEEEVRAVRVANETIATLPERTPLVFWVNEPDSTVSFLATRAGNVIRAGVPIDRIRDVVVVVPPGGPEDPPGATSLGPGSRSATSRRPKTRPASKPKVFVLEPFDAIDTAGGAVVIGYDRGSQPIHSSHSRRSASRSCRSRRSIVLGLAGFGWARIGIDDVAPQPRQRRRSAPAS